MRQSDFLETVEPRLPTRTVSPVRAPLTRVRKALLGLLSGVFLLLVAALCARLYLRHITEANLPQIEGALIVSGLSAPVTVQRDVHGVPSISARSLDDLVFAQAFVTTQDRLWQMDLLRRHAAGELAAILGPSLLPHDRVQRTLRIRASADRALATLPADELHQLTDYAAGVNAAMAVQREHLPVEFRVLRYSPAPWTPRDSLLIALVLFQDLTNNYQAKLNREALTARLPPELAADLYPIGSWRDHPPMQPPIDLTVEGPAIEEIPLDESQSKLELSSGGDQPCADCVPGSNNWVVAGTRSASGKPLLSNDMHLAHSVPGIWYEANLRAADFHVSGVTLPGIPFVIVGHNAHVAWGFTNLGADVQDLYIEQTRSDGEEFLATDGSWRPILHLPEAISVHNRPDESFEVRATRHGDTITPILTPILKGDSRTIALRWTLYDPTILRIPFFAINAARDWPSFTAALAHFGGPAQNVVYADDAGHIGYHVCGRIPLRGAFTGATSNAVVTHASNPKLQATSVVRDGEDDPSSGRPAASVLMRSGGLSSVPLAPTAASEWSGYIPFDQLPQTFDPPGGIIATANSRITPDDYPYPITLNWGAPYRNERIWKLLQGHHNLTAPDMLAIQTDIYSELDHVLAQRLAYAVDHSPRVDRSKSAVSLRAAADLLRAWNGNVDGNSTAANIVSATRAVLWPMLLQPHADRQDSDELYSWYERDFALEQLVMHTPARWLPPGVANWDDLLTTALDRGLARAKAPTSGEGLGNWRYGRTHTVDIEHPIFGQSRLLSWLESYPTGTRAQPQSGDGSTVKQVGHAFGPSERFTADFADLNYSTLNIVLGQSGNPASPWFLDQFSAWSRGSTFKLPFADAAATHTLTLSPR